MEEENETDEERKGEETPGERLSAKGLNAGFFRIVRGIRITTEASKVPKYYGLPNPEKTFRAERRATTKVHQNRNIQIIKASEKARYNNTAKGHNRTGKRIRSGFDRSGKG